LDGVLSDSIATQQTDMRISFTNEKNNRVKVLKCRQSVNLKHCGNDGRL
jgi:hypothetical protein